jgi:hypothetical protein
MSNIRFNVHMRSPEEDEEEINNTYFFPSADWIQENNYNTYNSYSDTTYPLYNTIGISANSTESLFTMLAMIDRMGHMFQGVDPLEIAIERSSADQELTRSEDININVSTQCYETTDKKFDSCSICTEKYDNKDVVSVLKCEHIFHTKCIKEWGYYKAVCPLCKESIDTCNNS